MHSALYEYNFLIDQQEALLHSVYSQNILINSIINKQINHKFESFFTFKSTYRMFKWGH